MKRLILSFGLLAMVSCSPRADLQGYDPKDYYRDHPVENKVETHATGFIVAFEDKEPRLSPAEVNRLRSALHSISPQAVETIIIYVPKGFLLLDERRMNLKKLLRSFGYTMPVQFKRDTALGVNEMVIHLTYNEVVLPDCPDWKMSPVTTYSNVTATNWGCANTVNLGLMVADPKDLVEGSGNAASPTDRAGMAVSDYRSGANSAAAPAASPSAATAPASQ